MTSKPNRLRSLQLWAVLLSLAAPALTQTVSPDCAIAGVSETNWLLGFVINIVDTDTGDTFSGATENTVITSFDVPSEFATNAGPYVGFRMEGGNFVAYLLDAFADYEEYEYSTSLVNTIWFPCHGLPLVVTHAIRDTNNHRPELQSATSISLATPLTAGALVPSEIIVRDIDITTHSITFEIEPNDFFEIQYIGRNPDNRKNFHARLVTTRLILGLNEPIVVGITATDNDETDDPQLSIQFTLTITADPELSVPASPVFSQAYYSGTYTAASGLVISNTIEIIDGFDSNVQVTLSGDDSSHFVLNENNGVISLTTNSANPISLPVPNNVLTFSIIAARQDEPSIRGTAAVFISVPEEPPTVLQFEQSYYSGTIENGLVIVPAPIRLVDGHGPNVEVSIINDHSAYFTASISENFVTIMAGTIPEEILEANTFFNLVLEASEDDSVSARTVVTLTIIPPDIITPVFSQAVYSGSYHLTQGLQFSDIIYLIEGYDETVQFYFEGVHSSYFQPIRSGNEVTLSVIGGALPTNVIEDNDHLVFLVIAVKESVSSSAAIHISLPLDLSLLTLQFEQNNYVGTIENGVITLPTSVTLSPGFGPNVAVQIINENNQYFTATLVGNQVAITAGTIPENVLTANTFFNLVIEATEDYFVSATTVVTLTIILPDVVSPVFSQAVYAGSYHPANGLTFTETIYLSEGFDETVEFTIDGVQSQYFGADSNNNQVILSVNGGSLPINVVEDNENLIFLVLATKGPFSTSAAIHISLPIDIASITLQFGQDYYTGTIENGIVNIPNAITLANGFGPNIQVAIINEHQTYFSANLVGNQVTIISGDVPEDILENNVFINLVVEASEDGFASATTVISLTIIKEDPIIPVFSQSLYSGSYDQVAGLQFTEVISLTEGFDETVQFSIEGEHSTYFEEIVNGNVVSLTVRGGSLPANVVADNENLIFLVVARKGSVSASAAIHIALPSVDAILQFEENYYAGTIENGLVTIPTSIALISGHGPNVAVNIINEHSPYFTTTLTGSTVSVIAGAIPDNVLLDNNFLNLVLEASEQDFVSAVTVVTLEVVREDPEIVLPVFSQSLYSGSYDPISGLQLTSAIEVIDGFDETVVLSIDGDHSGYFTGTPSGNILILTVVGGSLPANVLEDNSDLIFLVIATKGAASSSAAIHIALPSDAPTLDSLQFGQDYYIGSIEDNQIVLPTPVSLLAGHGPTVDVQIINEHRDYFTTSLSGSVVIITAGTIPVDVIEDNTLLNLVLLASEEGFVSATTVVTLTITRDITDIVPPVFSQTFYSGIYSSALGLQFTDVIELSEGFDSTVVFSIQGEHSSYFQETVIGNSVTLEVRGAALPDNVVESHDDLVFLVVATNGPISSSAAIHISLPTDDEMPLTVLRFERDVYEGTINDGVVNIPIISLSEGFSSDVQFDLIDVFSSYFTPEVNGNQVNIVPSSSNLPIEITQEPFINLVLQASGDGFLSTTTVITLATGTPDTPIVRPVFSQTFYRGRYEPTGNFELEEIILTVGYDVTVTFDIDEAYSAYFAVSNTGSTVHVTVVGGSLPESVLEANSELLFAVRATRNEFVASAAIHISLPVTPDTELTILRFEQDVYEGAINDGVVSVPTIILSEGFTPEVQFNLIDEFSSYFTPDVNGNQVNIVPSSSNLPIEVTQEPFINLVLQASGDGFLSATTVITLATGTPDTPIVRPVFSETFYRGRYEPTGNFELEVITLAVGYDETVTFDIDEAYSAYFAVSNTGSTVHVTVVGGSLPESVLEANSELLFAVRATRNEFVASAAIHISLPVTPDTELTILRFEQDVYEGAINDGVVNVPTIILSEGFTPDVQFNLIDEFSSYFTPDVNGNQVNIVPSSSNLPIEVTQEPFINLVLQASGDGFLSATTVITLATGTPDTPIVRPVFSETFYRGRYEPTGNFELEVITLAVGYDETVTFDIDEAYSAYFAVSNTGSTVHVTVVGGSLPESVLEANSELLFAVRATRNEFVASAAIHISLPVTPDTELTILRFEQDVYEGAINDGVVSVPTIILSEGFTPDVQFNLIDEFSSYFTPEVNGNQVNIVPSSSNLPIEVTQEPFINLVLQASGDGFLSATTVITLATGTPDTPIVRPVFSETFYRGRYEPTGNFELEVITLAVGYDETVIFDIDEAYSAYFAVSNTGSTVHVTVVGGSLPESVLEANSELLFAVRATRNEFVASAAIHISLPVTPDTELTILRFEQDVYEGAINDGVVSVPTIILSEGFTPDVQFNLIDEFSSYFTPDVNGNQVNIVPSSSNLPIEVTQEPFINLVLQASGDGFLSATTVITLATGTPDTPIVRPVFSETFYRGRYEPTGNFELEVITLAVGYDETVTFDIDEAYSAYFAVSNTGATVHVTVIGGSLPESVLEANNELLFAVRATRNEFVASAAIHISLPVTPYTELTILRFEQDVYEGAINDGVVSVPTIILSEGFTPDVQFNLIDEFSSYFTPEVNGNQVNIVPSSSNLPIEVTQEPFINLVLQASGDGFLSATTVITLATGTPDTPIVRPVFSETFYRGRYEPIGNFELEVITLAVGYDETVRFDIDEAYSAYFAVSNTGATVHVTVVGGSLPESVLEANNELLFAVRATRNEFVASAAIHISLPQTPDTELTILRFEQDVYEGVINDGVVSVPTIILSEGFTPDVQFNLIDEFSSYFTPEVNGNQVNIVPSSSNLPIEVTQEPFINLVLQASGDGFLSATTVITLATGTPDTPIVRPVFSETFYRGRYEPTGNFELEVITLAVGYDEAVTFDIDEAYSAYFAVSNTGSTVHVTVIGGSLPESVLEANNELLFAVRATRNEFVASAAIHISLPVTPDTELTILRFEQDVYEGVINDGLVSVPTIILSEGFTPDVQFNLIDEFSSYFTPEVNGNQVNIVPSSSNLPIEVTQEPFINLVLQASGDGFLSATTVITLSTGTPDTPIVRPVFSETFYRGRYEPTGNFEHEEITLTVGYDETVIFDIDEAYSTYFAVSNTGSTVHLTVIGGSLPESILEANNELLFAVRATRNEFIASASIHISLPLTSETELTLLRFERDVYEGTINDGVVTIPTIILSEGFSPDVQFDLIDEFSSYFTPDVNGNQVNIVPSSSNLPIEVTQEPFINLVLQASGDGFVSTTTVITLATGTPDTPTVRPLFSETFYRGRYEPTGNFELEDIILSVGHDDTVVFDIDEAYMVYFAVSNIGSTVHLTVIGGSLPESVLEANRELLFAVRATRGELVATATIHISLPMTPDTELTILRFEQDVYEGVINDGIVNIPTIRLSEEFSSGVQFDLIDEFTTYFRAQITGNEVNIVPAGSTLPDAVTEGPFINLILQASGDGFVSTTTVITLATGTPDTLTVRPLFSETFYRGRYEPVGNFEVEDIILSVGHDDTVVFDIDEAYRAYFAVSNVGSTVHLTVIGGSLPDAVLEANRELLFAVRATSGELVATAAIHISLPVTLETELPSLVFGHEYYEGTIINNQLTTLAVVLYDGFDSAPNVQFSIEGEHRDSFDYERDDNILHITMPNGLPSELLTTVAQINLILRATSVNYNAASTVITLSIRPPETPVFSEVIYSGSYNPDTGLNLESEIHLSRGESAEVSFRLDGDHSRFFDLQVDGNWIQLQLSDPITEAVIEANDFLIFSILASREGTVGGSAAISITLSSEGISGELEIPEVAFTSPSYYITASPSQTGVIGGVFASATNGEPLLYTLDTADEHLSAIVNIGPSNGQVLLMSPANSGVYQAEVTATTVRTGVPARADLTITIETVIVCGEDDFALNPLIILEREEEQAFEDVVAMNTELIETCRYEIRNSWPADQNWFYINENHGLSMTAVDREHPSIAHIHLSQVQIELALICENDEDFASQMKTLSRHARDVDNVDFGNREWVITNGIRYSRRQTNVNIIITDINDNEPIFVHDGNGPLTIGYPDSNALELISPRYFTQVQATDDDIGINAHILYSVENPRFTIHPDTGIIYLMPEAMSTLNDGYQFNVQATDEYGNGHSTSLTIRVRLLRQSQIATVTIENALLEDEDSIVQTISQRLNFEVRSLTAAVVPKSASDLSASYYNTRSSNREIKRDEPDSPTLTLHVYALDADLEPVDASTLVSSISNLDDDDINWDISSSIFVGTNPVTVIEESSVGLLAATISLSILIVLLVLAFIGWNIYTIRSNRYKNFNDDNSVSSTNPEHPGMREAPETPPPNIRNGNTGPNNGVIFNTITENPLKAEPLPKPVPVAPLVNITGEKPELVDDELLSEDEFGEMQAKRRKSVVTFNEYVEQINIVKMPEENQATEFHKL